MGGSDREESFGLEESPFLIGDTSSFMVGFYIVVLVFGGVSRMLKGIRTNGRVGLERMTPRDEVLMIFGQFSSWTQIEIQDISCSRFLQSMICVR